MVKNIGNLENKNHIVKGLVIRVDGDMKHNGTILTDQDAIIDIGVRGNYSSNKGKIIHGHNERRVKKWYEKPIGVIILIVIGGVLVSGVSFLFGWS